MLTDTAASAAPPLLSGLFAVDLGYVAVACTVGPLIGLLVRFPSPALLGALVAGLLLNVVPLFDEASVPPLAQAAAFIVIDAGRHRVHSRDDPAPTLHGSDGAGLGGRAAGVLR